MSSGKNPLPKNCKCEQVYTQFVRNIEENIIMHLKAFFFPLLFKFVKTENFLEYHIGNFFDRPKKRKNTETDEQYLGRLTPSQAVRISQYNYNKWYYNNAFYHVVPPDLSNWEEESRKTLENLLDALFLIEEQWKDLYRKSLDRKIVELKKPKKKKGLEIKSTVLTLLFGWVVIFIGGIIIMFFVMGVNHLLLALHLPIIKEVPIFGTKMEIPPPPRR